MKSFVIFCVLAAAAGFSWSVWADRKVTAPPPVFSSARQPVTTPSPTPPPAPEPGLAPSPVPSPTPEPEPTPLASGGSYSLEVKVAKARDKYFRGTRGRCYRLTRSGRKDYVRRSLCS